MKRLTFVQYISFLFLVTGAFFLLSNIFNYKDIRLLSEDGVKKSVVVTDKSTKRGVSTERFRRRKNIISVNFFHSDTDTKKIDFLNYDSSEGVSLGEYHAVDIDKWVSHEEWGEIRTGGKVDIIYLKDDPENYCVLEKSFNRLKSTIPFFYIAGAVFLLLGIAGFVIGRDRSK